MKPLYTVLIFFCSVSLLAQPTTTPPLVAQYAPVLAKDPQQPPLKMLCDPSGTLTISCEGENRNNGTGNNDPSDGAFMTWEAQGSSTGLYHSQIIQGSFIRQIGMGSTNVSVFPEEADGTMRVSLAIGGNTTNACIDPGTWIVRVWEVLDDNGDGRPDRDGNGDIIGCYTECTLEFLPSCPTGIPFSADVVGAGCTTGGSISLVDFSPEDIYCDGFATFSWTGPNGFTSTAQDITNLDPGDYTFVLNDFYNCATDPLTVTIGVAAATEITCGNPQAPSVLMGNDGSFDVEITDGVGPFNINFSGPVTSNRLGMLGTNTVTNVAAGDYLVTVTDNATGCEQTCTVVVPAPPCAVAFTVELDNIGNVVLTILDGQPNFVVDFSGTVGTPQAGLGPYSESTITLSANLFEAGNYVFFVREEDRPDCENFAEFTIPGPDCSTFALSELNAVDPTCGLDNGSISISLAGGNGGDNITWISGPGIDDANENSFSLNGLPGGLYSFQAFDAEGCFVEGQTGLVAADPLVFDCSGVGESCPDADDGKIGLTISGGTPPFTLNYSALDPNGDFLDSQTNITVMDGDSLFNLPPGDYTLNVTDAAGCSSGCNTVIEALTCPILPGDDQSITLDSVINATVVNATGRIVVSLSGTPDWEYRVVSTTGGQDTTRITSLTPDTLLGLEIDTYQLFLLIPEDTAMLGSSVGNGTCCLPTGGGGPFTFVVEGPECEMTVTATGQDITCFGADDGVVSLTTQNANGTPVIVWNEPALTGFDLTGLPPGGYSGVVTDDSGCGVPFTAVVNEPPPVEVFISEAQAVSCGGAADGELLADVVNAAGDVAYLWDVPGAANTPFVDNLPADTYTVEVTDGNGCSATATYILAEPTPLDLGCGTNDETNIGTGDGQVFFSLSGGNEPYELLLDGAPVPRPAQDTFQPLAPGEYVVAVIDANGCTATCTAIVNPGGCGDFSVSLLTEQPDCANANGSSLAVPDGNNGTVTFGWSHGPASAMATDLAPGDYSVTATDQFGCTASESLVVEPFADFPTLTVGEFGTTCADGCTALSFSVFGPAPVRVHYTLERAGTQVQGSVDESGGVATLHLCPTDFGFAQWEATTVTFDSIVAANGCARPSGEVRDIPVFAPALGTVDPVICASDTFLLGDQSFHADRLTGEAVLPGASSNGCDSVVTVNLSFFPEAVSTVDRVVCAGDTIFIAGQRFQADRATGEVVLAGASANGCDSTVAVNLSFFPEAVGSVNPQICPGDRFVLAGQVFDETRLAGEVVLAGASADGCDSTVTVSLTILAPASAPLSTTICAADTLFVGNEAFTFNRPAGNVVFPGAAANGCDSTVNVGLDFFAQLTGTFDTTICAGSSFEYAGRAFSEAVDELLVPLPVASTNGCDSLVSLTVRLRAVPSVSISGDGVTCDDGTVDISITYDGPAEADVELSSNPGDLISVVRGTTTVQRPVEPGTVITILSAEDGDPCPLTTGGSITVRRTDLAARIAVMSGDSLFAVSCAEGSDGAVIALAEGGVGPFTFDWNTGGQEEELRDLPPGNYAVIVTSGRGCNARAQVSLTAPDTLAVQVGRREATCLDPTPALLLRNIGGGTGPYLYSLDGGASFVTAGILPDTLAADGTITLTVEDSNGCTLTRDVEFAPAPVGQLRAMPENALITRGDSVEITVLTDLDAAGFVLTPGPPEPIRTVAFFVSPDSTTTYFITAVDSAGCTASDAVTVVVDQFVPVYTPNAFSPNQDGTNDLFRVYGGPNVVAFSDFAIFDRWGNRVFDLAGPISPDEENWGWDGRASDGRPHQSAVYVFSVIATYTNGTTQVVEGEFVLSR